MLASFESACPRCHRTIERGGRITFDEDADAWVHDFDDRCQPEQRLAEHPALARRPRCSTCADLLGSDGLCGNCGIPPTCGTR